MATRASSRIGIWFIVGLLVIGLGGWFTGGVSGRANEVAHVGPLEVDAQAYGTALRNQMRRVEEQTGQPMTMAQAQEMGLDRAVLANLVTERVLDAEARRLGLSIGDARVAEAVVANPAFEGIDGQFDREQYREALRRSGLDEEAYEASLRDSTARTLLQAAVLGGLPEPLAYGRTLAAQSNEARGVTWARVEAAPRPNPSPPPTPTSRPSTRRTPTASPPPRRAKSPLPGSRPRCWPRRRRSRTRRSRGLRGAAGRVRAGGAPAGRAPDLPRRGGGRGGTRSAGGRRSGLRGARGGAGPTPVGHRPGRRRPRRAGRGGRRRLRRRDGRRGRARPLLARAGAVPRQRRARRRRGDARGAAPDLRAEIAQERARGRISDLVGEIEDLLAGGATPADLAARLGLEAGEMAWSEDVSDGPAAYAEVRDAAAAAEEGGDPELVEFEDGGVAVLQVTAVTPPALRPLEEVRAEVLAGWEAEAVREAAIARAEAAAEAIAGGASFEDQGLDPQVASGVTRRTPIEGTSPEFLPAVFEMAEGEARAIPCRGRRACGPARLGHPADDANEGFVAEREAVSQEVSGAIAQDLFAAYAEALRSGTEIAVDDRVVAAVHAQFD
jgi:peptidyl-prolyl cis-trans isomerase D